MTLSSPGLPFTLPDLPGYDGEAPSATADEASLGVVLRATS